MPTSSDVFALHGTADGEIYDAAQVTAALAVVTALAKSYCRADWDTLPADVDAAVLTATLRYLSNPNGLRSEEMGGIGVQYGPQWSWSISERIVLDRYRVKAV